MDEILDSEDTLEEVAPDPEPEDGPIIWTPADNPLSGEPDHRSKNLTSIAYGEDRFVAAGYAGVIYSSTDGISWIKASSTEKPGSEGLGNISYGENRFVIVGFNGTIYYSTPVQ